MTCLSRSRHALAPYSARTRVVVHRHVLCTFTMSPCCYITPHLHILLSFVIVSCLSLSLLLRASSWLTVTSHSILCIYFAIVRIESDYPHFPTYLDNAHRLMLPLLHFTLRLTCRYLLALYRYKPGASVLCFGSRIFNTTIPIYDGLTTNLQI